jgi:hypothetical protein
MPADGWVGTENYLCLRRDRYRQCPRRRCKWLCPVSSNAFMLGASIARKEHCASMAARTAANDALLSTDMLHRCLEAYYPTAITSWSRSHQSDRMRFLLSTKVFVLAPKPSALAYGASHAVPMFRSTAFINFATAVPLLEAGVHLAEVQGMLV